MFSYQRSFGSPTRVVTKEQFQALITAPETIRKVKEAREALARGDKKTYDAKKKGLPLAIFIGTFEESVKVIEDKRTGEKSEVRGCWRLQKYCRLNGLVVADFDHLEGNVREIWAAAYARLSDEDKARIVLVFVTPSGYGLKVVFIADPAVGNLIDNISDFSLKLGLKADESGKDGSRGAFMTTADDIISINEENLFNYENKEFAERYNALYRDGNSQATKPNHPQVLPSSWEEHHPQVLPSSWEEGLGVEEKNSSTYLKEVGTVFIHPTPGPSPDRGGEYLGEKAPPLIGAGESSQENADSRFYSLIFVFIISLLQKLFNSVTFSFVPFRLYVLFFLLLQPKQ